MHFFKQKVGSVANIAVGCDDGGGDRSGGDLEQLGDEGGLRLDASSANLLNLPIPLKEGLAGRA
ncbi:hypothetical protein [Siccirubricoccus deserti]|uniref:Uncharacterized protein n=1 Tax=Siccirubricoccus deserti TaxID=2013562 RepID=A0A9X0R4P7_9PROT|nr:hypothetical protein [Siccirubricoccus deserti]MBC4018517.1 hypothetical protein [Siccirubricoccus deserti]